MALVAGLFLLVFGGAMLVLLSKQFPKAQNTRMAYIFTTIGGACSVVWAVSHWLALGVVAILMILIGSIYGVVGWARKELRMTL